MQDPRTRRRSLVLSLLLVALNLAAFNVLVEGARGLRIDLTEEGVFTISPATERLVSSLEEPLTLYGFFSERTHPKLAPLVPEIEDMLDELAAIGGGRVDVRILDPGEDSEAEELASQVGSPGTELEFAL